MTHMYFPESLQNFSHSSNKRKRAPCGGMPIKVKDCSDVVHEVHKLPSECAVNSKFWDPMMNTQISLQTVFPPLFKIDT